MGSQHIRHRSSSEGLGIRIGYVPEHYLAPLHLALGSATASLPFNVSITAFPAGTGAMIHALRHHEIDIAIGLTEGWVAGLVGKEQLQKGVEDGGYKVIGQWVETPLRWAIVTGSNRDDIEKVDDLRGGRVGVSRMGSGSHIMSFVLAQQQKWPEWQRLRPVVLGPFGHLRDGVTGDNPMYPNMQSNPTADFFMWEHFTTKPYFHLSRDKPYPPLKKVGEIYTPWPSWHIAASTRRFPDPENDGRLKQLCVALDKGIQEFNADRKRVVHLLGVGELDCHYSEEDATEWIRDVRFVEHTRGVDKGVIENVVKVLKTAGVVPEDISDEDAVKRVIGIPK